MYKLFLNAAVEFELLFRTSKPGRVRCSPGDMDQPESSVWRSRTTEVMERTPDAGVWQLLSFLSQGLGRGLAVLEVLLSLYFIYLHPSGFEMGSCYIVLDGLELSALIKLASNLCVNPASAC